MKIENFKGPYISHVPEIKIFELDRNDKYLILSSDGMWDELKNDDVMFIHTTCILNNFSKRLLKSSKRTLLINKN